MSDSHSHGGRKQPGHADVRKRKGSPDEGQPDERVIYE